jgi:RAB protein geranylgeranyltransferase component A
MSCVARTARRRRRMARIDKRYKYGSRSAGVSARRLAAVVQREKERAQRKGSKKKA